MKRRVASIAPLNSVFPCLSYWYGATPTVETVDPDLRRVCLDMLPSTMYDDVAPVDVALRPHTSPAEVYSLTTPKPS